MKEDIKESISLLPEMLDIPDSSIKILKVYRSINSNSYSQAQVALEKLVTYSNPAWDGVGWFKDRILARHCFNRNNFCNADSV